MTAKGSTPSVYYFREGDVKFRAGDTGIAETAKREIIRRTKIAKGLSRFSTKRDMPPGTQRISNIARVYVAPATRELNQADLEAIDKIFPGKSQLYVSPTAIATPQRVKNITKLLNQWIEKYLGDGKLHLNINEAPLGHADWRGGADVVGAGVYEIEISQLVIYRSYIKPWLTSLVTCWSIIIIIEHLWKLRSLLTQLMSNGYNITFQCRSKNLLKSMEDLEILG
jgi:hypothetical protein